jgi:hypothetical protein
VAQRTNEEDEDCGGGGPSAEERGNHALPITLEA